MVIFRGYLASLRSIEPKFDTKLGARAQKGHKIRVLHGLMEIYTHPRMEKKREAQSKVMDVLFGRQRLEEVVA